MGVRSAGGQAADLSSMTPEARAYLPSSNSFGGSKGAPSGEFGGLKCVVIDTGSGTTKVGYAGEDAPRNFFPSITARSRGQDKTLYVGHQVAQAPPDSKLAPKHPIVRAVPEDWSALGLLWEHALQNELEANADDMALVLTDAPMSVDCSTQVDENRRKMGEKAFEELGVKAITIGCQPVLSLFSTGRTTGCVVEVGEGASFTVPVFDGLILQHAVLRQELAGQDITSCLLKTLIDRNLPFAKNSHDLACTIKEKVCYVASDFESEGLRYNQNAEGMSRSYELPDTSVITVGPDRYKCPEILFQPELLGADAVGMQGLHKLCASSIGKIDTEELRTAMFENVVLSGGSSMLPGIGDRMQNEVSALATDGATVSVITDSQRKYAAWVGGSMLGSLPTIKDILITKDDYDEGRTSGEDVIAKRCFT